MIKYSTLALVYLSINVIFISNIQSQGFNSITTPDGINLVAVGNNGKMYRSANGGTSWVSLTNGTFNMNSVASLGNDVWIAANLGTVYKTQKTSSPATSYNVGSAANLNSVSFPDANVGYVCGDGGAVYKSINGGVNWTSINSGLPSVKLNSISFRDIDNGVVAGDNGTLYMTSNGGTTWLPQAAGTSNNLLKVKYFTDGIAVTGEKGTLLKYTGASFSLIQTRINTDIRGVTGLNINDVHVCGGGGFIRNNRSGSLNFLNFEQNPMMAQMTDIFYFDANKGWGVCNTNSVIIFTTNGGTSWSMPAGSTVSYNWVSKTGASGSFLGNNLSPHPSNRNTVFLAFTNQVYVSRNRGENWSSVGNAMPGAGTPHSFYVSPIDTNIWLCAMEASTDIIVRTTNYGSSWSTILTKNFSNYGQPLEMDQNNPSVYYFAGDSGSANGNGGFFKSTNNGASFTNINTKAPFRSPCDLLVQWDNSDVLFVADGITGSGVADIFKSINGGINWTKVHSNASSAEVPSMTNTQFDNNLIWATEWGGSNVYRSTNNGTNFSNHHSTGFSGWGSDICREDPTALITGSWGNAATLSLNSGANWTTISSGLSGHGGGILFADRSFVLAQQGSNIYKLNVTYTDSPVLINIDVQALSLGNTGVSYYANSSTTPTGTVKNNNGGASATFNVTRTISPGNYVSTKSVINLAANATTVVNFDQWTFNAGTVYTVRDSVYIFDDTNPLNDVLSGSLTPYLGEGISRVNESFAAFPPSSWTFQFTGTNYWIGNNVSAYGNGTGSAEYNFWNANAGTNQSMFTPTFASPSVAGDSLKYDYAYAPYTDGSTDSLIIETSTNGGTSYSVLVKLFGRNNAMGNNALNTAPATNNEFVPLSNQWAAKRLSLPVGTNKIKFRARSGFGNNLFMDNINVGTFNLFTQYNVKLAPQGFYNGSTLNMRDTVKAYLRSTVSPFNTIDSSSAVVDSVSLTAPFVFEDAASGTYYIQIIHRNALETWSKTGGEVIIKGITANFDFTSAQSQSYGSNAVQIGSVWCVYSGDVIVDGAVDLSDIVAIYNDASIFNSGYITTDLNGDGTADLSDIVLAYNNSSNFVTKVTPETSPSDVKKAREITKLKMDEFVRSNRK